jgi:predicted Fe-Mo cluster-binding NifX family protein
MAVWVITQYLVQYLQDIGRIMRGVGMMKTAFAYWGNRLAPVFDTARQIHIIKAESGKIMEEAQETLPEDYPIRKVRRLVDLDIGILVCGAISRPLHAMISSCGIQVVPFIAGGLHEVIQAWLKGNLEHAAFALPGCYGRGGWRFREMHSGYREAGIMKGRGRGMSAGGNKGWGQGGRGRGHMGGSQAAGSAGNCICPQCGQTEPYQRSVPCVERKCPKCGTDMTRQ